MPSQPRQPNVVPFPSDDPKIFSIEKFRGINTQASRPAINDEEFSWLENMMPIGDGNMRSMASNGAAIYTASGKTIVYHFPFNLGTVGNTYAALFFSDGTAVQVNLKTAAVTTISAVAGTFYAGGGLPACAQWGSSGIVIVAPISNGYWAWDGTTLFATGAASPTWLNGGTPTNMPTGVSGAYVEIFLSRVWVDSTAVKFFSAPSNGASFSGATGGGSITPTDSFVKQQYTASKQANGFLYSFADSSINVISNVVSSGSPITTTFNNQNVDLQSGTIWQSSIQPFGRSLIFANPSGVYELQGGTAVKISEKLDGIFASANFGATPATAPTAAVMTIYGVKVYMILINLLDPFTNALREVLCVWDGKKWFLASQDFPLNFVSTQEIFSVISAWGSDSTRFFPLFNTISNTLKKTIQTRLWPGRSFIIYKKVLREYVEARDNTGNGFVFNVGIDTIADNTTAISTVVNSVASIIIWLNSSSQVIQFVNSLNQAINFTVLGLGISGQDGGGATGCLVGATITSLSQDFTLVSFALLYQELAPFGG